MVTRILYTAFSYLLFCFCLCTLVSPTIQRHTDEVELPIGANLSVNGCLSKQHVLALG